MESMETMDVNLESPAARNAAGVTKLMDHSGTWKKKLITVRINKSWRISAGGLNRLTNGLNRGSRIRAMANSDSEDKPMKDLINLRASWMFRRPIHWPTTVTMVKDKAPDGICASPAMVLPMALVAMAYVPRLTIKIWVSSLPPLKNICSAAKGSPINIIFFSMDICRRKKSATRSPMVVSILIR
ncbi:hypothetical protein D3C75_724510 [compost metagenome]